MAGRQVAWYFAWSRPDEVTAPLGILEDRFPALFELRRFRRRLVQISLSAACDEDECAFGNEVLRRCQAKPAASAGDQGDLVL
jgi:hypothetical protein